jgi:hypothetical protein
MGYHRHRFYGKLAHLGQEDIVGGIDALVAKRYLTLTGGDRPVLGLSANGLAALKARSAIPVPIRGPASPDPAAARRKKGIAGSSTIMETLALFRQGQIPVQIAQVRGLTVRTIYNHLARLIADGKIELESLVSPNVITQVRTVAQEVGTDRLSPIKERLPDSISYEEILCVVAELRARTARTGE